jgi:hypothetical protein
MITTNERQALQAIVDSEYQNGSSKKEEVVGNDVWAKYCNPFANKRTQSGTYASLAKKGFITTSSYGPGEDTVAITDSGWDALQQK